MVSSLHEKEAEGTIYQPLRSGRIWHKVNFQAEFNRFWIQSFPSPRLVASPRLKNLVRPTIYLFTYSWRENKGVHTFPKGICPKVNVIARLEYELAYYDSAVHRFNHYTRRYSTKTITDADNADDIALLVNAPAQAETRNEPLQESAPMSIYTKRNICALTKQATSPH